MRKLCACLLLSGLMVVGCNKPSSGNTGGRINTGNGAASGTTGNNGDTNRRSNYGPTQPEHGAQGARPGANNNLHGATPPNANVPPASGNAPSPGIHPNTRPGAEQPGALNEQRPNAALGEGAAMHPEQFASEAWRADAAEIKLAQLAEKNGSSDTVKTFARTMIRDHTQANEQLQGVLKANHWNAPQGMSQHDQQQYDRLAKLKGQEFDRAYIQYMLKDHEHDVRLFQQEARNLKNPELRSWVQKTLPVLEHHLHMAENAARELHIATPAANQ